MIDHNNVETQPQTGHILAQDQKESRVACSHKRVPKIPVYTVCNRYIPEYIPKPVCNMTYCNKHISGMPFIHIF